jgi:hypothetical protein
MMPQRKTVPNKERKWMMPQRKTVPNKERKRRTSPHSKADCRRAVEIANRQTELGCGQAEAVQRLGDLKTDNGWVKSALACSCEPT